MGNSMLQSQVNSREGLIKVLALHESGEPTTHEKYSLLRSAWPSLRVAAYIDVSRTKIVSEGLA